MDQTLPALMPPDLPTEIAALARRYRRANGPVMQLMNRLGNTLEGQLDLLPEPMRQQLETTTARALDAAYGAARRTPDLGQRGPMVAVVMSGAVGGAGGIATALAEIPVSVTLILNAIRAEARAAGFDPDAVGVREDCLRIFGAGSPLAGDDGVNTSFLTARLALTGQAVQNLIASVAPKFAAVLGQKLAAQAVPVLGAVTGAALNAAFLTYYRELARIRFALVRLYEVHGIEPVNAAFRQAVEAPRIKRA
ncbi:MAG: EcsC family protein [Rhodobacterales bacterium]|nr:EcsC family protein [Rhodobacterales bacterium]